MVWGPWWPRYPGHCGPRLYLGLCGRFQLFDLGQIDPVNDDETVLAGARVGLDKDTFFQKLAHGSLDRRISQLGVTLDRSLGTPDA